MTLASGIFAGAASAATFPPTIDQPPFTVTQFDVDAAHTDYYAENHGITNGFVAGINTSLAGRINFLDLTDFVSIDYLAILAGTYEAFSATGALIDSFSSGGGGENGTRTLSGGLISYVLFSGQGGYVTVSGLTCNYDGVTDGNNDDIGPSAVPLPAGGLLLLGDLGLPGAARRRRT